jgi:hypothetical protein
MTAPLGRSANICIVPTTDTKTLIEGAVARFIDEVPALRTLAVVIRLELRERGGPAVWRIELPAKTADHRSPGLQPAGDKGSSGRLDRRL